MTIIIPTYFYKPCNLTPVNRIHSWVEYFSKRGIYVVVITRHWDEKLNEYQTLPKPLEIIKYANYEVHYLPYNGNWRTKINSTNRLILQFRKALTFLEILTQNFMNVLIPFKNLIAYTKKIVPTFESPFLIISGNPFALFKVGYFLRTKHGIPWIADYRDGWTESAYSMVNRSILGKGIDVLNRYYERKWVGTASCFITVSDFLVHEIQKVVSVKGHLIYNGFIGDVLPPNNSIYKTQRPVLTLLYSGEIYKLQDYPEFISVFKECAHKNNDIDMKLVFLGANTGNHKIAPSLYEGFEDSISVTNRLAYSEALEIQAAADCFIMLGHGKVKGGASSKMFDYLKNTKKIILFTSDHDILEELLNKSNLGLIANNRQELVAILDKLVVEKRETGQIAASPNIPYIQQFNRENQAKKLLEIITNAI
jgi:glycosyltransferase involved in cell wall biosynthesis